MGYLVLLEEEKNGSWWVIEGEMNFFYSGNWRKGVLVGLVVIGGWGWLMVTAEAVVTWQGGRCVSLANHSWRSSTHSGDGCWPLPSFFVFIAITEEEQGYILSSLLRAVRCTKFLLMWSLGERSIVLNLILLCKRLFSWFPWPLDKSLLAEVHLSRHHVHYLIREEVNSCIVSFLHLIFVIQWVCYNCMRVYSIPSFLQIYKRASTVVLDFWCTLWMWFDYLHVFRFFRGIMRHNGYFYTIFLPSRNIFFLGKENKSFHLPLNYEINMVLVNLTCYITICNSFLSLETLSLIPISYYIFGFMPDEKKDYYFYHIFIIFLMISWIHIYTHTPHVDILFLILQEFHSAFPFHGIKQDAPRSGSVQFNVHQFEKLLLPMHILLENNQSSRISPMIEKNVLMDVEGLQFI